MAAVTVCTWFCLPLHEIIVAMQNSNIVNIFFIALIVKHIYLDLSVSRYLEIREVLDEAGNGAAAMADAVLVLG